MKFKGKVAAWFWLIIIAVNAVCIYELLFDPDNVPILLFSLALCDIIFIPIVVRNYVVIEEENVKLFSVLERIPCGLLTLWKSKVPIARFLPVPLLWIVFLSRGKDRKW